MIAPIAHDPKVSRRRRSGFSRQVTHACRRGLMNCAAPRLVLVLLGSCLCAMTGCGAPGLDLFGPPGHDLWIQSQTGYYAARPTNTLQLSAVKVYRDGRQVVADPREYKWSSSNPAAGTVDRNGLFTAITVGQTEIACIEKDDSRVQAYQIVTVDWAAPSTSNQ